MIQLLGVAKTIAAITKFTNEIENYRKVKAVDGVVKKVEADMKQFCPKDDLELHDSIHAEEKIKGKGVYIVKVGPSDDLYTSKKGIQYSIHQEFGTSKMEANAYVRPAHDANIDEMEKAAVGMFKH